MKKNAKDVHTDDTPEKRKFTWKSSQLPDKYLSQSVYRIEMNNEKEGFYYLHSNALWLLVLWVVHERYINKQKKGDKNKKKL